jgi:NAD(P)-dependent dehydrogenase (short-subunit alcohol dehydrogenase family)
MQTVVITGVSTGIGYAATKLFTANGIKVFGSVRNENDANRLQHECGSLYIPLIFDVTDEEKIKQAAQLVRQELQGSRLWGLINNAGIVVSDAMMNIPIDKLRHQLEINLIGQLIVTQAFIPLLGADPHLIGVPGKIINISSVAGKYTYPFMCPYSISKHGLEALSEGLRRELMMFGIDVIIVGPGAIKTNIWDKAKNEAVSPELEHSPYRESAAKFKDFMLKRAEREALPAEQVAQLLLDILKAKHPKVRYAPVPNKIINWIIPNLLPKRWIDKLIAKKFDLTKK